jgi:hypothetical protein
VIGYHKGPGHVLAICGAYMVQLGFLTGLLVAITHGLPDETSASALVTIDVAVVLYLGFFQLVLVAIGTSGDRTAITAALHAPKGVPAYLMHYVALLILYAVPEVLVTIPAKLRKTRPWPDASNLAKTLVPSWLAASAAAATFGYLFAQHWFGGPLSRLSLWAVLVSGLAAAALLAPGYQFMARSLWEHGVEAVLDAGRWRKTWRAVRFELLGFKHPDTLTDRAKLALRSKKAGRVAVTLAELALPRKKAGHPAATRDLHAARLPIEERVLGAEDPRTLTARGELASWTAEAGDAPEARDQYAALLAIRERLFGAEHPDTLTARGDLARWTGEAGDAAAARDQYAALLASEVEVFGAEDPRTLTVRASLARWTGEAGDAAAARDQYAALLAIEVEVFGPEDPRTLTVRGDLARWIERAEGAPSTT